MAEFVGFTPELRPASDLIAFLDATAVPALVVDEGGAVVYANEPAALLLGYPVDDLIGLGGDDFLPQEVRDRHAHLRAGVFGRGEVQPARVRVEVEIRRRDGTTVPVEVSFTPVRLGDQRATVAGLSDTSERVRAKARLAELSRAYLTLAQLTNAIVRAPDVASLYGETCRVAVEQGGYAGAMVAVPTASGDVVVRAREGRLSTYIDTLQIVLDPDDPRGLGPTAVALREQRPRFSSDYMHDVATAPWHARAAGEGIRSSASLPLRENGVVVAALTLFSDHAGSFEQGIDELVEQVADNVSHALDGFASTARLERERSQRQDLMRRLVTAQETERARIAADIHDDSVQSLAAVELRLGLLRRRMATSAVDLLPMVDQLSHTVRAASDGLRHLLFELEPPPEGEGWTSALRAAAEQVFEDHPIEWSVSCDDQVVLSEEARVQALRIVKEALINVRKHAGAEHVRVVVSNTGSGVEIAVVDDGVGSPPEIDADWPVQRAGHRGLATMRDRAAAVGGSCRWERGDGGGTRMRLVVPLG